MSGDRKPDRSSDSSTVNPGDVAAPGTPGTGENVCQDCKGSGRIGTVPCQTCGGTGKVIEGISGA
jgi:RecJ-like exonuclease